MRGVNECLDVFFYQTESESVFTAAPFTYKSLLASGNDYHICESLKK